MPSIANSNAVTKQDIRDVCSQTIFANFAANATTPTVVTGGTFKTFNSVATILSDFLNGFDGQRIVVVINDANTTVDFSASNLIGNGGVDWVPNSGDSFTAVRDSSGLWFCQLSSITDHTLLSNIGTNSHAQLDTAVSNSVSHIADGTLHYTVASIDHALISNIGTNTHAQLDTAVSNSVNHIADGTLHYTVASIDHILITNVGTNSHAQIDIDLANSIAHIADTTKHFLQSDIIITRDQVSDLGIWTSANNGVDFATTPVATADNAFAIGDASEAADISAIALGTGAYASGEGSIAFGWGAIAQATDTIGANTAIGTDAYALGSSGATALGYGASAEEKNTIAIGDVQTDIENEIKIGFDGVNELRLDASGALIINNDTAMYKLPTYTVATVPTVNTAGVLYVSDGAAGLPVMAFSDGISWLRSDTLAAIAVA